MILRSKKFTKVLIKVYILIIIKVWHFAIDKVADIIKRKDLSKQINSKNTGASAASRKQPSQIKSKPKPQNKERCNFVTIKSNTRKLKQPVSTIELKICNNEFQIERKEIDLYNINTESNKMQEHKDKTKAKQDNSNSHAKVNLNRRMWRAKWKSTSRLNNENLLNVKSQSITNQNANSNQKQRSNSFKRFDIKITTRKSKSMKAAREDFVISNNE